jgi:hypothetical protein
MPSNDTEQTRAHVRELARVRVQKFRMRNRKERLPTTREIDNVLRDGLRVFMAANGLESKRPLDPTFIF